MSIALADKRVTAFFVVVPDISQGIEEVFWSKLTFFGILNFDLGLFKAERGDAKRERATLE